MNECPDPKCRFGVTERVYYDQDGDPDREQDLCDWPGHGIVLHPRLERIRQRGVEPTLTSQWEALTRALLTETVKVRLTSGP
jgi:hypothetical protein